MKVIDFYAGIGGWALGFRMAGLEVVQSYEWWSDAVATHEKNIKSNVIQTDIRQLNVKNLPNGIDIVIGSPPCTEFSYANRGGSGDISNGLVDIEKFLEIISYIKPKYWAMENVPRVKSILDNELKDGGVLSRFNSLGINSEIIDMSEYGVPQKRKRCIAGNFNFSLLKSYRAALPTRTLGHVVSSLHGDVVIDAIYKTSWPKDSVSDDQEEVALNEEEVRYNREWKTHHPVYNDMRFPDSLDEPVRTITATCTRVSRESVVILNGGGRYRRLSVRERGCLQSFPVGYQFHGANHQKKVKMIGNAIPPLFTFYIAQAMLGVLPEDLIAPEEGIKRHSYPIEVAPITKPDREGQTYPSTRRFWFAIPGLRFKSGFRFELVNENMGTEYSDWPVHFWYGNSKDIRKLNLRSAVFHRLIRRAALKPIMNRIEKRLSEVESLKGSLDASELQDTWSHRGAGTHPFTVIDRIGEHALEVARLLAEIDRLKLEEIALGALELEASNPIGKKVKRYAREVLAGILVGARFNTASFRKETGHHTLEAYQ